MEEKQGKRVDILPVVLDNRNQRTNIARPEICFIKLRYHLAGDIVFPLYPQDLPLESGETQGGECIFPAPPAEVQNIEMGDPTGSAHAIICQAICEVGEIEGLSIERDKRGIISGEMINGCHQGRKFF